MQEFNEKKDYSINDYDDKKVYVVNKKEYKAINKTDVGSYITLAGIGYIPMFNKILEEENAKLPDDKKVPLIDFNKVKADILAKVQDPENVALANIYKEISANEQKQDKILADLKKEFPDAKLPDTRDYLARSIKFLLKTEDTAEAKKFNKELFQSYHKNPEAFTHVRMKNLMKFDATKIMELGDDKVKLLEFYRDNRALCQEANEFGNPIRMESFGASKEFKNSLPSFQMLIQKINIPGQIVTDLSHFTKYIAMPNLTEAQAKILNANTRKMHGKIEKYDRGMLDKMAGKYFKIDNGKDVYQKFAEKGAKVDENLFLKYKVINTNPETGEKKEDSLEFFLNGKPNYTIEERSKDEIDKIFRISKAFTYRYSDVFQKKMGEELGDNYNIFKVISDNKGGYFENLFNSTSREYKEFINALADFTNPEKEGFLDDAKLKEKTDAYLAHTENVKPNKNENNATRIGRIRLANAVKNTLAYMKENNTEITNRINGEIISLVPNAVEHEKEPAIEIDDNIVEASGEDLNKAFIMEKSIEEENEINIENN